MADPAGVCIIVFVAQNWPARAISCEFEAKVEFRWHKSNLFERSLVCDAFARRV